MIKIKSKMNAAGYYMYENNYLTVKFPLKSVNGYTYFIRRLPGTDSQTYTETKIEKMRFYFFTQKPKV